MIFNVFPVVANDLDDNTDESETVINVEIKQVPEDIFRIDDMVDDLAHPLDPLPQDILDSIGTGDTLPVHAVTEGLLFCHF